MNEAAEIFTCCQEGRRAAVKDHATLNGIDFLEVQDVKLLTGGWQTILTITLLKPLASGALKEGNILISGGERTKNIKVLGVNPLYSTEYPEAKGETIHFEITVDQSGDFSQYTLSLVEDSSEANTGILLNFDQLMYCVDFSFKAACPKDFDCKTDHVCPPSPIETPNINYLANDYASFRQLMLDRMSLLTPGWKERNPADLGIALVEVLAYAADYLSYKQDAVATEAYLGTARKRSSVRRHARLVDYFMHDGCNARTWVQVCVRNSFSIKKAPDPMVATDKSKFLFTQFWTKTHGLPLALDDKGVKTASDQGAQAFEPMHDIELLPEHNEMHFYTWGESACCLPKGATQATLLGKFDQLEEGNVLILSEKISPGTGRESDADPVKRHAVRLKNVKTTTDSLFAVEITEIEWESMDALPFPLCISTDTLENVSVALGNILLADHGLSFHDGGAGPFSPSSLYPDVVPDSQLSYPPATEAGFCSPKKPDNLPLRYKPQLKFAPLTQAAPLFKEISNAANTSEKEIKTAFDMMRWDMRDVRPSIHLFEQASQSPWQPYFDLLNAGPGSKYFVIETESDGISRIRFGNGIQGERPEAGVSFRAIFRIGNGKKGNIGAGVLAHMTSNHPTVLANMNAVTKIWNPLPARGGTEPESMEEVRQYAPEAFRTQKRAVTNADYEYFAQKLEPEVQRAAATLRWTGSWRTVFLSIDRYNGLPIKQDFEDKLRYKLEPYRMAGFDLAVDGPLYVNLDISLKICVKPGHYFGDVKKELLEVLGSGLLTNGRKGVFHTDNYTFGQSVFLSAIYATAQTVAGVSSVVVTKLARQGDKIQSVPDSGEFKLGRREIARCDNDPSFPERGRITILNANDL